MSEECRHINNPFAGMDNYNCFGCDPENPIGLHLEFQLSGDEVIARWEPHPNMQGFPGVIHGGIQATLADEIGGWYVMVVLGTAGVTRSLEMQYERPARAVDGPFLLRARGAAPNSAAASNPGAANDAPASSTRGSRDAIILVTLENAAGEVCARARCVYATFSEAVARRRFGFPGKDALLGGN